MKTSTKVIIGVVAVILLGGIVLYSKAVKSLPPDGAEAKMTRFNNLRDVRYAEIFLIAGNGITKDLSAAFYNTTARNNEGDSMNTCPQELWDKIDVKQLKEEYNVLAAFKNGPRHWTMDWIELGVGIEHDFNGLKARWMGVVKLPKQVNLNEKGSSGYKPTEVARKSQMGFSKGKPVFALIDPQGRPWVMQAYSLIDDRSITYEGLNTLGQKLVNIAAGWKYKVIVLDQDLVIHSDGIANIVQDELGNTYDLCEVKSSNFIPK